MKYYLLVVYNDVEPVILGPYKTQKTRDRYARKIKKDSGDKHGIFMLNAVGKVSIDFYTGGFFNELP